MMFTIDAFEWPIPCDIKRSAEVKSSEISGYMLDGSYFNDVDGTYMTYTVTVVVPASMLDTYAQLYEILTAPVDGHECVFPYNGDIVQITARVGQFGDVWRRLPGGAQTWTGLQFTLTANHPTKQMDLGEVLTRGRTPLPDASSIPIGTTYTMTASGWQLVPDGSDMYF